MTNEVHVKTSDNTQQENRHHKQKLVKLKYKKQIFLDKRYLWPHKKIKCQHKRNAISTVTAWEKMDRPPEDTHAAAVLGGGGHLGKRTKILQLCLSFDF